MRGVKRTAGAEVLAHWRESGAWWAGEPQLEIAQWRDRRGVRREKRKVLQPLSTPELKLEWTEDHTTEIALKPRKTRDEKVAKACGRLDEDSFTERLKASSGAAYAPLNLLSGYSFGRSVLLARELPRRLALYGLPAGALVDRMTLAGSVEFSHECKNVGVKPLVGATFELEEGGTVVLIARDKSGYQSLSQLVTECHLGERRLHPLCNRARLESHTRGLLCLTGGDDGLLSRLLLRGDWAEAERWLDCLTGFYGRTGVFVEVERSWSPWSLLLESRLTQLAQAKKVAMVAGGAVTHGRPHDFPAQDVALCAETLCTVDEVIGRKPQRDPAQPQTASRPIRSINAEKHLRTPDEAFQLYSDRPELLETTLAVANMCDTDVLPSRTRLPDFCPDPAQLLRQTTYEGARRLYGSIARPLGHRIEHELERIVRLNFSTHFLVAWDVCRWATENGVHLSGRGSVVDSVVAYCLGLSRVDAYRHDLHFDRFLPEDGSKRPDIDIDFEARRRDDVRSYMESKYGTERVATVAAVGAYNTRGIVREVGKALGFSPAAIGYLAKRIHGGVVPDQLENALEKRPELRDSGVDKQRMNWLFRLAGMLADVPRNMRAHSSGIVVSDRPLAETVPVQWAGEVPGSRLDTDACEVTESPNPLRIIQWDKRSAKHFFDKFDILCLRGQDVLSGVEKRVKTQSDVFEVQTVPAEHEENFRAMRSGELIGVPQSASPAMRQAHMRLQTRDLHDASLVQAGIRPGVGGAVKLNELIARRRGEKAYTFEHPDLEAILGHTYGIVVFQEQIDQLLQVFAGYGSGEAEDIRDEIHKRRREDYGSVIRDDVVRRILARGYGQAIAESVFNYVAGFKGYGFAQGHALAFAEISLRSIYCQQNYPSEYFAALLDAQPAGYYGPCTLVNEARSRGVSVLPVDVNRSADHFEVEDVRSGTDPKVVVPHGGIRLSLGQVSGISRRLRTKTVQARGSGYRSFADYVRRCQPDRDELDRLVLVGAFDEFCSNRRALMWAIPSTMAWAAKRGGGLWSESGEPEPPIDLDVSDFTEAEKAVRERAILGLDVERHLMCFERERVRGRGGVTASEAKRLPSGKKAIVVGNPIRLRFPPTPSGKRVVFFDLEDETGLLNVTCFDAVYQRDGHSIVTSPYVTLIGVSQWRDGHTAFLAQRVFPYDPQICRLVEFTEPLPVTTADYLVG